MKRRLKGLGPRRIDTPLASDALDDDLLDLDEELRESDDEREYHRLSSPQSRRRKRHERDV